MTGCGSVEQWLEHVSAWSNVVIITGAGCSVPSGIPAYRGADGRWLHRSPIAYDDFLGNEAVRRRYWAGSLQGWQRIAAAEPNVGHRALAQLEEEGYARIIVTQNVDGLHRRAGSRRLVELHGDLASVVCVRCGWRGTREGFQQQLLLTNPVSSTGHKVAMAPDGDALVPGTAHSTLQIPDCEYCKGLIKPDVVFFGEAVPRARVDHVKAHVEHCESMLIVGSSLTVFSGFRFVKLAAERRIPIAVLNRGATRANAVGARHLDADVQHVLPRLAARVSLGRRALCDNL